MFTVYLIVILGYQGAVQLQDNRGPYDTEAQCETRLAELVEFIATQQPGTPIIATKCKHEPGSYSL